MTALIPCQYFKHKITNDFLERIRVSTDLQVSDTEVPGFHLRYYKKTDHKVLYLHYVLRVDRMKKDRNLKLGLFPEISAPEARAAAIKYRGQVLEGIDPFEERKERLRKIIGEQDKKLPLKIVMEKYLEEHSKVFKKHDTSRKEFQMARKHIIPMIGNIPIDELSVRHLEKMHQTIGENTKTQANHCLLMVSYFLNWCEKQEYRSINTNPVRLIRKFKTKGRDRVMSDAEYQRFFEALDLGRRENVLNPIGFDILEFIAFTGCRSAEAKKLTWDEVDFDNSILRLKDSKTGRKSVPIGQIPLSILKSALRNKTSETSPVFPSRAGQGFYELYRHWKFITEQAGLENLHIHDLRHSFATTGSMTGENMAVIGQVLGHSAIATTQRYTHINNVKGIEVADNIAERIAKKAHRQKAVLPKKHREPKIAEEAPKKRGKSLNRR